MNEKDVLNPMQEIANMQTTMEVGEILGKAGPEAALVAIGKNFGIAAKTVADMSPQGKSYQDELGDVMEHVIDIATETIKVLEG